ncbi:MAG: response regulator SirA, partial [Gemmatimonadaceae bacterium]
NQAGVMMPDVNEDFVSIAKNEGWYSAELMERIAKTGTVEHTEVPKKWQKVFITANLIAPEWHIKMQAAFQQHCDSAISKTTNFAYTATKEDVRKIYEMAYEMDCKGVTVYRDGSRDNQVLSTGATADAAAKRNEPVGATVTEAAAARAELGDLRGELAEAGAEIVRLRQSLYESEAENLQRRQKRSRPDMLRGTTIRKETPLGTMFVNITEDDKGQPFEVFVTLGKAGGSAMADAEAMGRLISLALRSGIQMPQIHRQLRGISSDRAVGLGPNKILSVPDAIGIALEEWVRTRVSGVQQDLPGVNSGLPMGGDNAPVDVSMTHQVPASLLQGQHQRETAEMQFGLQHSAQSFLGTCPDCGSGMEYAEGCAKCHVCGFSECG